MPDGSSDPNQQQHTVTGDLRGSRSHDCSNCCRPCAEDTINNDDPHLLYPQCYGITYTSGGGSFLWYHYFLQDDSVYLGLTCTGRPYWSFEFDYSASQSTPYLELVPDLFSQPRWVKCKVDVTIGPPEKYPGFPRGWPATQNQLQGSTLYGIKRKYTVNGATNVFDTTEGSGVGVTESVDYNDFDPGSISGYHPSIEITPVYQFELTNVAQLLDHRDFYTDNWYAYYTFRVDHSYIIKYDYAAHPAYPGDTSSPAHTDYTYRSNTATVSGGTNEAETRYGPGGIYATGTYKVNTRLLCLSDIVQGDPEPDPDSFFEYGRGDVYTGIISFNSTWGPDNPSHPHTGSSAPYSNWNEDNFAGSFTVKLKEVPEGPSQETKDVMAAPRVITVSGSVILTARQNGEPIAAEDYYSDPDVDPDTDEPLPLLYRRATFTGKLFQNARTDGEYGGVQRCGSYIFYWSTMPGDFALITCEGNDYETSLELIRIGVRLYQLNGVPIVGDDNFYLKCDSNGDPTTISEVAQSMLPHYWKYTPPIVVGESAGITHVLTFEPDPVANPLGGVFTDHTVSVTKEELGQGAPRYYCDPNSYECELCDDGDPILTVSGIPPAGNTGLSTVNAIPSSFAAVKDSYAGSFCHYSINLVYHYGEIASVSNGRDDPNAEFQITIRRRDNSAIVHASSRKCVGSSVSSIKGSYSGGGTVS